MKLKILQTLAMLTKYVAYGIFVQILIMNFLLAGNSNAQKAVSAKEVDIFIQLENNSVKNSFNAVEDLTDFSVSYDKNELGNKLKKSIIVSTKNMKVSDLVLEISKQADLKFKQVNKVIHAKRILNNDDNEPNLAIELIPDVDISGKVTDENNQGLPGALVLVKGTSNGVTTDLDGNYKLSVPDDAIITVSFIGYVTEEISVAGRSVIDLQMKVDEETLDEVVVIGYGTQKKSDLTSSISQINGSDIERSPVSNVAMALQGRATGVEMLNDGTPGKAPNIRIRGVGTLNNSEPLIVLDGVIISADVLSKISPYEIQSIEVLKDAASGAIYGTRAANGVVLVTSKSGKYNQKTVTRFNVASGVNQLIKKYPVANGEEIFMLKRERYEMDGIPIAYPWTDQYFNQTRTDWQDEMFRTASFHDYNLQISGGNDVSTYHASVNYRDEEGTALNTWYKRLGINLRSTQKVSKRFSVEENIRLSWSKDRLYNEGGGTSVTMYPAYKYPPSLPVKFDASNVRPGQEIDGWGSGRESDEFGDMWNPVYKALEEWNYTTDLNALINLKGVYEVNKNISIVGTTSYTHSVGSYERFKDVTPLQSRSESAPNLEQGSNVNSLMLGELYASYKKNSNGHNITATAGTSTQLVRGNFMNMRGIGFASTLESQLVMDNADVVQGGGGERDTQGLLSYYLRGTYNFENRYYLSATVRADGSSNFADGNKWGYFPAVSAAWRISNEAFMSNSTFISNMKLNVGYGELGNQNVAAFQYLNIYRKDRQYIINGNPVTGTRLGSFANPDITWETAKMLNLLLETSFLNDKLVLNVAYFDKKTSGMLISPVRNYTAGNETALPQENSGEMSNKGFEFELSYGDQKGDFGYNVGINATLLKNKLLALSPGIPYLEAGVSRTYVGEAISSFYGWKTEGIYQNQGEIENDSNISEDPRKGSITPGDVIFVDTNGDNLVDEKDRVNIGDGNPRALLGIFSDFSYKGLKLSLLFSGALGQELYDEMMMRGINSPETDGTDRVMLERWTGEGSTNKWPRMSTTEFNQNYRYSQLGLKSGNYVRLKDVTFSYSIPASFLDKLKLGQSKVFISGRNLLTFTSFDGTDVEETGRSNLSRGVINNNYPTSKTITLGLDISF